MGEKPSEFNAYESYTRWSAGSGVFRCFFRSTVFVSLKHYPDFTLMEPVISVEDTGLITSAIGEFSEQDTIFILDLPGETAVKAAFLLQNQRKMKAILTFNNILHPYGLVGTKEFISSLLYYGNELEPLEAAGIGFAFILDCQRYRQTSDEDLRGHFNNQYELTEGDLPSAGMLKELKYEKLVYVYDGNILEDIGNYLNYLASEGMLVERRALRKDCGL